MTDADMTDHTARRAGAAIGGVFALISLILALRAPNLTGVLVSIFALMFLAASTPSQQSHRVAAHAITGLTGTAMVMITPPGQINLTIVILALIGPPLSALTTDWIRHR